MPGMVESEGEISNPDQTCFSDITKFSEKGVQDEGFGDLLISKLQEQNAQEQKSDDWNVNEVSVIDDADIFRELQNQVLELTNALGRSSRTENKLKKQGRFFKSSNTRISQLVSKFSVQPQPSGMVTPPKPSKSQVFKLNSPQNENDPLNQSGASLISLEQVYNDGTSWLTVDETQENPDRRRLVPLDSDKDDSDEYDEEEEEFEFHKAKASELVNLIKEMQSQFVSKDESLALLNKQLEDSEAVQTAYKAEMRRLECQRDEATEKAETMSAANESRMCELLETVKTLTTESDNRIYLVTMEKDAEIKGINEKNLKLELQLHSFGVKLSPVPMDKSYSEFSEDSDFTLGDEEINYKIPYNEALRENIVMVKAHETEKEELIATNNAEIQRLNERHAQDAKHIEISKKECEDNIRLRIELAQELASLREKKDGLRKLKDDLDKEQISMQRLKAGYFSELMVMKYSTNLSTRKLEKQKEVDQELKDEVLNLQQRIQKLQASITEKNGEISHLQTLVGTSTSNPLTHPKKERKQSITKDLHHTGITEVQTEDNVLRNIEEILSNSVDIGFDVEKIKAINLEMESSTSKNQLWKILNELIIQMKQAMTEKDKFEEQLSMLCQNHSLLQEKVQSLLDSRKRAESRYQTLLKEKEETQVKLDKYKIKRVEDDKKIKKSAEKFITARKALENEVTRIQERHLQLQTQLQACQQRQKNQERIAC